MLHNILFIWGIICPVLERIFYTVVAAIDMLAIRPSR